MFKPPKSLCLHPLFINFKNLITPPVIILDSYWFKEYIKNTFAYYYLLFFQKQAFCDFQTKCRFYWQHVFLSSQGDSSLSLFFLAIWHLISVTSSPFALFFFILIYILTYTYYCLYFNHHPNNIAVCLCRVVVLLKTWTKTSLFQIHP